MKFNKDDRVFHRGYIMKVYIFVTPGMAEEKTTFILESSKKEAIKIYCNKYNESKIHTKIF